MWSVLPRHGWMTRMIEQGHGRINTQTDVSCFGSAHSEITDLQKLVNFMRVELQQLEMAQQEGGDENLVFADTLVIFTYKKAIKDFECLLRDVKDATVSDKRVISRLFTGFSKVIGFSQTFELEQGHDGAIEKVGGCPSR
jgi:hypothetical protein